MKKILFFAIIILCSLTACDEDTDNLGTSIADYDDNVEYTTDTTSINSESMMAPSIYARSQYSYLGCMYDTEIDATITANYMTQFNVRDGYRYFHNDTALYRQPDNTNNICNSADSCFLVLTFSSFYGDSLTKMKVTAHEMETPYQEGLKYNLSYDPMKTTVSNPDSGHVWKVADGGYISSSSYTISNTYMSSSTTSRSLIIPLNKPFTRKDKITGKTWTYNNYGSYIMNMYYKHPEFFESPLLFNKYVCSGLYLQHTFGQGALGKITGTALEIGYRFKYSSTKQDSLVFSLIAGTNEVIQHTSMVEKDASNNNTIADLVDYTNSTDCNYTLIKSPVGVYTKLALNVDKIMAGHENDTLSTVRVFLPCLNNSSDSKYNLEPPTTLLMIRADSVETFFSNEKITNNRTSFTASYSSAVNGYTFSNISTMITEMARSTNRSSDWNKVVLIPVETSYNSSGTLLSVTHSINLQSVKLKKGTGKQDSPIVGSIIYSTYK